MNIETKKSSVDLTALAISVVVLGVVVSIGASILITMRNNQITSAPTYLVRNETVTVSSLGTGLAQTWVKEVNLVTNSTGGELYNSGNWSLSVNSGTGAGTFTNLTSKLPATWNVSYTVYNTSDPRYEVPNEAAVGLAEYGNWFKILVIVAVAAVVLALLFRAFGKDSNSELGGNSY